MSPRFTAAFLVTVLLVLVACDKPADGPSAPAVQLQALRGQCQGEVDVVIRGVPARLGLRFDASRAEGASGTADITTQFGGVACVIDGEARRCEPTPGAIPFLPTPLETAEETDDERPDAADAD